jgi:hypothetical protein
MLSFVALSLLVGMASCTGLLISAHTCETAAA